MTNLEQMWAKYRELGAQLQAIEDDESQEAIDLDEQQMEAWSYLRRHDPQLIASRQRELDAEFAGQRDGIDRPYWPARN